MTDTRDAFEAWVRHLDISTEQDGWQGLRYTHSHVQAMWEGWQAATLAERERMADSLAAKGFADSCVAIVRSGK